MTCVTNSDIRGSIVIKQFIGPWIANVGMTDLVEASYFIFIMRLNMKKLLSVCDPYFDYSRGKESIFQICFYFYGHTLTESSISQIIPWLSDYFYVNCNTQDVTVYVITCGCCYVLHTTSRIM